MSWSMGAGSRAPEGHGARAGFGSLSGLLRSLPQACDFLCQKPSSHLVALPPSHAEKKPYQKQHQEERCDPRSDDEASDSSQSSGSRLCQQKPQQPTSDCRSEDVAAVAPASGPWGRTERVGDTVMKRGRVLQALIWCVCISCVCISKRSQEHYRDTAVYGISRSHPDVLHYPRGRRRDVHGGLIRLDRHQRVLSRDCVPWGDVDLDDPSVGQVA